MLSEDDLLRQLMSQMETVRFIQQIDTVLRPLSYSPQARGVMVRALEHLASTRLPELEGSADEWFNLATRASRVSATAASQEILAAALKHYPHNVDLLCSVFQAQFSHGRVTAAGETWQQLEDLGQEKTGPYWRYWVYGATYCAVHLHDRDKALALLDNGLTWVPLADLLNIYRQYRVAMIDGGTLNPSTSREQVKQAHQEAFERIRDRYQEGVALGIETGYVLATDLAKLLREHAASEHAKDAISLLDEALRYLSMAESLYTNDPNHPVTDIYIEKAMALMAQHRYADALHIFRSLPGHLLEGSLEVMAHYAAQRTGEEFKPLAPPPSGGGDDLQGRLTRLEQEMAEQQTVTRGLIQLLQTLRTGEDE